ncbi:MAG: nucleotide exchange factor GrpE [Elusimicrobiota bacterium]
MSEKQNNQSNNNHQENKKNEDPAVCQEQESAGLTEKLAELEILRQSLAEKKKQAEDYYDQLVRLKAEMENYRKRTEKQLDHQYQRGRETVLVELVRFMDVLEKAQSSWQEKHSVEIVKTGLEMIAQELSSVVGSLGLKPISVVGEKFDPGCHEALEQEEKEGSAAGEILRELRRGYSLNGRVIRPAQVVVAKDKKEETEEENGGD